MLAPTKPENSPKRRRVIEIRVGEGIIFDSKILAFPKFSIILAGKSGKVARLIVEAGDEVAISQTV